MRTDTVPLYDATKSLNVNYMFSGTDKEGGSISLSGNDKHAVLYAGLSGMMETRSSLTHKTGRHIYAPNGLNGINIATGIVTLLFSDTSTDEGYLGEDIKSETLAICDVTKKQERILSTMDYYTDLYEPDGLTKSLRCKDFNSFLRQRTSNFATSASLYDYRTDLVVNTTDKLDRSIKGEMFHETFHHSEQAMMHYLSTPTGINVLVSSAQEAGAAYLYGIVLDIYTQRMLCSNCNASLIGMQRSQHAGFLFDLQSGLAESRIQTRPDGQSMLSTRVSASAASKSNTLEPLRLQNDANVVHEYNPDQRNTVFQAENQALGVQAEINRKGYDLKSYEGDFFLSSKITAKEKLEEAIRGWKAAH